MRHKGRFVKGSIMLVVAVAALGGAVMWLWNTLMPALFTGVSSIGFFQAIGLLLLCRILFGGFHGHGAWHHQRHMQRWAQMSEEEKERFFNRFGCPPRRSFKDIPKE